MALCVRGKEHAPEVMNSDLACKQCLWCCVAPVCESLYGDILPVHMSGFLLFQKLHWCLPIVNSSRSLVPKDICRLRSVSEECLEGCCILGMSCLWGAYSATSALSLARVF